MTEQSAGTNLAGEQQAAYLTAIDPHASTTTKPWELEISSKFLRNVAIGWVVLVMVVHIFMAWAVNAQFSGVAITGLDQFAFIGVGLIISVLSWIALTRPRVRANEDGVQVANIIGTRFYPWTLIYGLSFPKGSRMARLELPEFEYVTLWAIQSGDKERAIRAVEQFRALEAKYMPQD
ncbi:PH domain-containing protein [Corynebacterium lujinxingii]|uniref:PH domain-containing protein n=1 Tax=Corynebacterium lujinxingii TaxID=2763010 RepID=A0A7H0JWA7_9CORY|nr:PH domain-containing protein [Corynebacterium lujinxingii]MBC3178815.1 PH domain-containing protein [Corynebacterium lujinxingii]NNO11097.1 PH domain-containing protein [Corynebacterium lujinxingii]QNP89323.1 PH domain-containing protein [Corynebacterium lujinxingii]